MPISRDCGNSSACADDGSEAALELLAAVYKYVFAWLVPLLYVSGCAGTFVCVAVLMRRGSTQKEARPWFIALSLTDLCVLSVGLPIMYLNIVHAIVKAELSSSAASSSSLSAATLVNFDPRSWNAPACYGLTIVQYYSLIASSWVQVGISLTRCLSAIMPLTCRRRLNYTASRRALMATLTVPMALAIVMVSSSVRYDSRVGAVGGGVNSSSNDSIGGASGSSGGVCARKWKSPYYFYSTLVLRVFLPAVCLAVSTAVIMYSLHRFKRTFQSDTARLSLQQRRISIALIGMNSTFLLFALPYELYLIYASQRRGDLLRGGHAKAAALKIVERVFAILMYTNNATNWIFYFVLGRRFRQELQRRLVCCGRPAAQAPAKAVVAQYKFRPDPPGARNLRSPPAPAMPASLLPPPPPSDDCSDDSDVGGAVGGVGCGGGGEDDVEDGGDEECEELRPLRDSPIGGGQRRRAESARGHAGHRMCHVSFRLTSV